MADLQDIVLSEMCHTQNNMISLHVESEKKTLKNKTNKKQNKTEKDA